MKLQYTTIRQRIADRLRQPELLADQMVEGTIDLPAFQERFLDRLILKVTRQLVREVPADEIESLGGAATTTLVLSNGDTIPLSVNRIISAALDGGPDEPVSETMWYLRRDSVNGGTWSVIGRKVVTAGSTLVLHVINEVSQADLENDLVALPQGWDNELIDRVVQWIEFADDMEEGRLGGGM